MAKSYIKFGQLNGKEDPKEWSGDDNKIIDNFHDDNDGFVGKIKDGLVDMSIDADTGSADDFMKIGDIKGESVLDQDAVVSDNDGIHVDALENDNDNDGIRDLVGADNGTDGLLGRPETLTVDDNGHDLQNLTAFDAAIDAIDNVVADGVCKSGDGKQEFMDGSGDVIDAGAGGSDIS